MIKKFAFLVAFGTSTQSFGMKEQDPFLSTPKVIRLCIADFLELKDFIHLSQTCKTWQTILHEDKNKETRNSSLYHHKIFECLQRGENLAKGSPQQQQEAFTSYKMAFMGGYWPAIAKIFQLRLGFFHEQKALFFEKLSQSSHLPTQNFFKFYLGFECTYDLDGNSEKGRELLHFVFASCKKNPPHPSLSYFVGTLYHGHFIEGESKERAIEFYEKVEKEIQELPEETKKNLIPGEHSMLWEETSFENYMEKYMGSLALCRSLSSLFKMFYDKDDKEKCDEYALKSANYGHYLAMVYLFEIYRKIPPLKIDESNIWLQNILALKNPDIFFHIGEMYYGHSEDLKLVRNLNFARFFYGEAAKLGLEKAKEAVKNLDNGEFL